MSTMKPLDPLRMEYKPPNLLIMQQTQITKFCVAVRESNPSLLGSSTTAIVYSHASQWWHSNTNDPKEHVTVRYDRRQPATARVHIYKDGSANLHPHKPLRGEAQAEDSDGSVEFSDEEESQYQESDSATN